MGPLQPPLGIDLHAHDENVRAIYAACGADPTRPLRASTLARRLLGPRGVQKRSLAQLPLSEAAYSRADNCILLREDLFGSPLKEFRIYEEIAEFWVFNCVAPNWEKEPATRQLGAALRAPHGAYLLALERHGMNFRALAKAFRADPVSMSLRYGEVTASPTLLVSDRSIAPRGTPFLDDHSDEEIRAVAFGPKKARGIERYDVEGDRRRVLLVQRPRRAAR
jgi:hypothetical protein